ncbi:hypothetical protein ACFU2J_34940, partial [Streptomyces sp. NPDC057387]
MGFLDRLRGRRDDVVDGDRGGAALSAGPVPESGPGSVAASDEGSGAGGSTASSAGPGAGPATGPAPVVAAAWTGLPPIQRATGAPRTG